MKVNKYFSKSKDESVKQIVDILEVLNANVNEHITNSEKPILDGNIGLYNAFLKDKHIPENAREITSVLSEFSKFFKRSVIWENPGTMINITPPANIPSIATAFYASLFNPNFAQDEPSGYLMTTELLVSKYLSELCGWNPKKARGIFTFGGKGTNLYAVKTGIKKAIPNVIEEGIYNKEIVVFSNEKSHPCHREVCDWLGLGKNACHRLSVDKKGQVRLDELEQDLRKTLDNGKIIGCIILNGGTTNEIIVDPIKPVFELRNKLVNEYNLDYIPHIHVDAVIGWAWLMFKNYDFNENKLNMTKAEYKKIRSLCKKISEVKYADSFGADFHKTGFCPYVSSIFMAKNYDDVMKLGNKTDKGIDNLSFGEYSPFEYTLELTRSCIGPVAAYTALETFGISGLQTIIYNVFSNAEYTRDYLNKQNNFEVINMDTEGIATLFIVKKPGSNKNYDDYVKGDSKSLNELVDYNQQFYLYALKKIEEGKINFKIAFSKSYKPYGATMPTGALKIYCMSPIVNKKEVKKILNEIVGLKKEFDNYSKVLKEHREMPVDYVYRD